MKIAMIGQKGIPATHGGPERHVEELAVRMVARGHEVVVYTRPNYTDAALRTYKGVRLASLPSIGTKHLDAITHVTLCTALAMRERFDVFHYQAEGPALLSWLPRLARRATVVTIHGQDWRRDKWGRLASGVLRLSEWVAMKVPREVICVSETLAEEMGKTYGRRPLFIPNGVSLSAGSDDSILDRHGLEPGRYVLFASRLVPEKGCHYLLEAWRRGDFAGYRLAVAGGSAFSDHYVARLHAAAPREVVFTGYVYGPRLASLFRHAALFVLPSDIEGLPIVLLEALGYGTPVLASDIVQNREALGRYGVTFAAGSAADLRLKLEECLARHDELAAQADEARAAIVRDHDWEKVADRTLAVYESLLA